MRIKFGLLSIFSVLTFAGRTLAESRVEEYDFNVVANDFQAIADEREKIEACSPDSILSFQIFIHDSVIDGKAWDAASAQAVKDLLDKEMLKANQGFCHNSIGAVKTQFTHTFTFLSNQEFPVANMPIRDVLNEFSRFWQSGVKRNGSDLGAIYVKNPDAGTGGVSFLGPDVGLQNRDGGPALSWHWQNKGEVIAHELGHFFGANHDGTTSACPAVGDIMGGGRDLTWSVCSRNEIQNWLRSSRSFYYHKKLLPWLNKQEKVGPVGGSGGVPFISNCGINSHVVKVQIKTGSVANIESITDIGIECSDGTTTISGSEPAIAVSEGIQVKAYGGSWLTGINLEQILVGSEGPLRGEVACKKGTKLAGFFGRKGAAIDNIGLICLKEPVKVGPIGGPGTANLFELNCKPGDHVSHLIAAAGDVVGHRSVTNIGITCTNGQRQAVRPITANLQSLPNTSKNGAIKVFHGSWINGIEFGQGTIGANAGPAQTKVSCPPGQDIIGIFGSYGAAIDAIGLNCQ